MEEVRNPRTRTNIHMDATPVSSVNDLLLSNTIRAKALDIKVPDPLPPSHSIWHYYDYHSERGNKTDLSTIYVPRSACTTLHDKIEVQYVSAYVEISRRPSAADGIAWLRDEISAM